jgi:hypothetical protein
MHDISSDGTRTPVSGEAINAMVVPRIAATSAGAG